VSNHTHALLELRLHPFNVAASLQQVANGSFLAVDLVIGETGYGRACRTIRSDPAIGATLPGLAAQPVPLIVDHSPIHG